MRFVLLVVLACPALLGEFLEVRISFDAGGCVSCAESLEQRLGRVRGVESVELNLEEGVVSLELTQGNRVRLLPLLSRVEQGGAKMLDARVVARGVVRREDGVQLFQPAGLRREYRLEGDLLTPGEDVRVQATVVDVEKGVLRARSSGGSSSSR